MPNLRVLFRESVGLVISAVLTTSIFGAPLLGFVHQMLTKPDIFSAIEAPLRTAAVIDMESLRATLDALEGSEEPPADEALEPVDDGPADVDASGAAAGGADERRRGDGGREGTSEPALALVGEVVGGEAGTADGESRVVRRVDVREGSGRRGRARKGKCDVEWPQIVAVGDRAWQVDRRLVEYYGSSIARLDSLGWSGRHSEEGEQGWKIGGFGCNSPLHHAGLRRGDIIRSVNGRPTKNLVQVFNTWRKLKRYDDFEVVVLRRGETLKLRYRLI